MSLIILVYWSIAAACLLSWDLIPEFTLGTPPDLRTIAQAGVSNEPVRWSIQVIDDPKSPDSRRTVGEATTATARKSDGWSEMTSHVEFDAGGLLRGTAVAAGSAIQLEVESTYRVDPAGNLNSFDLSVKSPGDDDALVTVTGRLKGANMVIVSRGPVAILNTTRQFPYEPRAVVRDLLGPLDRMPGLHVGQRWETRVVNPFTGQADVVKVEVKPLRVINWDGNVVTTFEVEQKVAPLSTRTWVRTDGLILRQEVPLPFVRLVLDRKPDPEVPPHPPTAPDSRRPRSAHD
jgi:hypothetical protein